MTKPHSINGIVIKIVAGLAVAGILAVLAWGYSNEKALTEHNVAYEAHPSTSAKLEMLENDVSELHGDVKDIKRDVQGNRLILERIDHAVHDGG